MQQPPKLWLLATGAFIGLAMAAYGLLDYNKSSADLPADVAARVNNITIDEENYQEALLRLQSDSRNPLDEEDRRWVLNRLIEEELLVQHGLALGMAHSEHNVRGALVRALISSATAEADASNPEAAELLQFYEDNIGLFTTVSAIAVRAWTTTDRSLAEDVAEDLAAGDAFVASPEFVPVSSLPSGLLPISKLRDYLGPTLTTHIQQQSEHAVAVYPGSDISYVVEVLQRDAPQPAPYESVKNQVLLRYRQSLADEALRDYVAELRDRATIVTRPQ